MTDVRDREPQIELKAVDAEPRATLVSRALAPIRRVTGYDVSKGRSRELSLRVSQPTDLQQGTESYAGIIRWSFILVVLVPAFLSGIYFLFVASDEYVADTRFAVREANMATGQPMTGEKAGGSGGSPFGGSMNLETKNAEIIANYIKSRAIIDDVSRTLDVRAIFRRPGADWMSRLSAHASLEDLATYWNRMISVYVESSSGIVTVSATAFRREDALALVRAILAASDKLANSLSVKMQADQTRLAEDEVRRGEGEVRFALAALQTFRNAAHLIDPVENSKATIKLMFSLIAKRIEAEGQLYVAERSQGPDAPGMTTLRAKLASINGQIKGLQDQLAGDDKAAKNMAAAVSQFEQLKLNEQFAEQMYKFAQTALERARLAAIRQVVYLEVFVEPALPGDAEFPQRGTDFALMSFAALMIWLCGMTISASVLDHRI